MKHGNECYFSVSVQHQQLYNMCLTLHAGFKAENQNDYGPCPRPAKTVYTVEILFFRTDLRIR